MKEPLKVGDRVRVFGNTQTGEFEDIGKNVFHDGSVMHLHVGGWVQVKFKDTNYTVHPKQCRRLKPKAKRREWWINQYGDDQDYYGTAYESKELADLGSDSGRTECIHVREVKAKS